MSGTRCADPDVTAYASVETLPADALEVLTGLFGDPAWWRVVQTEAMPPDAKPLFVVARRSGHVAAVAPMLRTGVRLAGLTTPYTCEYAVALAAGLDQAARTDALGKIAGFCRRSPVTRLDALSADWDGLAALEAAARRAGLVPIRFDHFGTWYEDVAGLDWTAYLQRRQGALRETIRRRLRRSEKMADARFELFTQPYEMDRATTAFEAVYARSWKDPEPYPAFNVALMRAMAASGRLRLGVWSVAAVPVAVQLWVVDRGRAMVLKLAHDEDYKAHSPGTVLTALMLRHLLDQEHVAEIDFGRGDDPYKQGWAMLRRQRIGILLVNPWRPSGLAVLVRHAAGRMRDRVSASPH